MATAGTTAIQESRRRLGMTQQQVAERLGVTRAAVQQYERNEERGTITLTTLRAVLDVVGGSVQVLPAESPRHVRRLFIDTAERLASEVASSRSQLGLSTAELAARASVPVAALEAMESGSPGGDLAAMVRVLRELDIHPLALPSLSAAAT